VRELISIVDYSKGTGPTIKTTYFPDTQNAYYWTSTTYSPDITLAWVVDFNDGTVPLTAGDKATLCYVRCVRGGPP
jgi:uncharacterized protein (TIGR02145 family)